MFLGKEKQLKINVIILTLLGSFQTDLIENDKYEKNLLETYNIISK